MNSAQPGRTELERTGYSRLGLPRISRALIWPRRPVRIGRLLRGLAVRTALPRRSRPRLALAAVVIGIAAAADVWVATYKSPNAERIAFTRWLPGTIRLHWSFFFTSPAWVVPSALGIGLLGLAAAAIVLRLRLTAAVFTLAAGIAAAIALHAYLIPPSCRACGPGGHIPTVVIPYGLSPTLPRPGWVGPIALGIVLLALATAAGVLVAARRSSPK
jgi:hypothetical protein